MLFWLFLGGFVWVIGDILQQFAVKYVGIGRGIPLSNTNQLWGLAWGTLVFGELAHASALQRLLVISGSLTMVIGAIAISSAVADKGETESTNRAIQKECERYNLSYERVLAEQHGESLNTKMSERGWWDFLIVAAAVGIFIWLGSNAGIPPISMDFRWLIALAGILIAALSACGWILWRQTKFS